MIVKPNNDNKEVKNILVSYDRTSKQKTKHPNRDYYFKYIDALTRWLPDTFPNIHDLSMFLFSYFSHTASID